jgi:hypothetical protein
MREIEDAISSLRFAHRLASNASVKTQIGTMISTLRAPVNLNADRKACIKIISEDLLGREAGIAATHLVSAAMILQRVIY